MTDVNKAMPRIEEGAKHKASGPGDYVVNLNLDPKNLYVDYKLIGRDSTRGVTGKLNHRIADNVANLDKELPAIKRLWNKIKGPFDNAAKAPVRQPVVTYSKSGKGGER